jgi:putative FmdB family regulatory protein
MPLYEFDCAACGQTFERLVRTTDWRGTPCPHCGSKKLTKRLSTFAPQAGPSGAAPAATPTCPTTGRACGCVGPHRH